MNKENYRYKLEHGFGLDTEGMLIEGLKLYKDKISEMAERYNVSKFYTRRAIIKHTFRKMRRGKNANLEKSVDVVERWLKMGGGR